MLSRYNNFITAALLSSFLLFPAGHLRAAEGALTKRPEVKAFINEMVSKHNFDRASLTKIFDKTVVKKEIIAAISRPAESKPWYQYRPIFYTDKRIKGGLKFWEQNKATLEQAEQVYGVPPEIITAIIGVETFYGAHKGSHRVMDALSTLAFDYPPRSKFFRSELEQYLLLTREENIDPLSLKGSYAGAMGKTQFISSSYRHYAVDFDKDGKRDLWDSTADAIGSVAAYFKQHGWQKDGPITSKATVSGDNYLALVEDNKKPHNSINLLKKNGVQISDNIPDTQLGTLLALELKPGKGQEHWVGYNNFYVITRYNHSILYAMAVYQLSEEIRRLREESVGLR